MASGGGALAIREFGLADEAMVSEMFLAVTEGWSDVLDPLASGPRAFVADPATFMFGAYVDHDPVGFAWGTRLRYPSGRIASYLHQIDVLEAHRRQGIATMLIEAAMDKARRDGHDRFWLSTGAHNEVAQALYEHLGGDRKPRGDVNFWWDLGG